MARRTKAPAISRLLGLLLPVPLLLGCVSVRAISGDRPPVLAENEGLLVLDIDSEIEVSKLVIDSGAVLVQDLPAGRHLLLFAVSAGEHRWTEIVLPGAEAWGGMRFRIARDDAYRFRVRAGRTNYPGKFLLRGEVSKRYVSLGGRIAVNRSGETLVDLLEQYPETLRRYPPTYGGFERDDFLDFYAERVMASEPTLGEAGP